MPRRPGASASAAISAPAPPTSTARSKAVLDDILQLEPQALATVKRLVLSCATADDGAVLDDAAESLVGLLRRPQASEGIKAFMAKTAPSWAKG